jgi:hypothetical protein
MMLVILVVAANYLLLTRARSEPSSISIPCNVFKQQVEAGNLVSVTGEGDTIRGTLAAALRYPPEEKPASGAPTLAKSPAKRLVPRSSKEFLTQRPAFADPGLEALLESKGAVIDSRATGADSRGLRC